MRSRSARPHHLYPNVVSHPFRFDIEILNDLHVIRNKTDRRDHDIRYANAPQVL